MIGDYNEGTTTRPSSFQCSYCGSKNNSKEPSGNILCKKCGHIIGFWASTQALITTKPFLEKKPRNLKDLMDYLQNKRRKN